jgi:hypothetical protein
MNGLRNLPISRRLWLILLSSFLMLLALTGLMLKQIHHDLYQAKALKTHHVVETALGVIKHFHGLESTGMSRADAQKQGDGSDPWSALRQERVFLDQRHDPDHGHAPDQSQA